MKNLIIPSLIKSQTRYLLLLVLLPSVVYFNSLYGSFQYDDRWLIERPWISDIAHYKNEVRFFPLRTVGGPDSGPGIRIGEDMGFLHMFHVLVTRPALLFTFAVNNTFHPNQVFGFHLVNLLLHILVTILVFEITRLSQEFLCPKGSGPGEPHYGDFIKHRPLTMGLIVALLFALHPLATDSVSYISSRSTLLASFFYLLSLYVFLKIFTLGTSPYRWIFQTFLTVTVLALYYLALASKLTAATLPVLLGVWFVLIISPAQFPRLHVFSLSNKMLAVYFIVLLIISMVLVLDFVQPQDKGLLLYGYFGYFLTQLKVIVFYYLRMFFFPINQSVDIGFPFFTGADPKTFLAFTLLLGLVALALLKGNLLIKAGTAWFFMTLAPTSSFFPLNDLAVEHRLYLPMSLGLCLVAGQWVTGMAQPYRLRILMILLLTAGTLTTARNQLWLNEITLWQDAMRKSPNLPRPYSNVGKAYYEQGEKEHAIELFRKSISLSDGFPTAHYNLANVYMDFDRLQEAEDGYQAAIQLDPEYFAAYLGLGSVYNQTGRYDKAIEAFNLANERWRLYRSGTYYPEDYSLAKLNLGEVYGKLGRFQEAIKELKLALKSDPAMFKAHFNLGNAYLKLGDLDNAERSFLHCLETNSQFEQAQFNLAHVYQKKSKWQESNRWFEKFLQTKGPEAKAYFELAWNHQQMAKWDLARSFYIKSLVVKPDYLVARVNLANVYIQLQQFEQALSEFVQVLEQQPKQFKVHLQMGIIYWKTKSDKTKAEHHFKKALEIAPRTQEKTQISQLIKALANS